MKESTQKNDCIAAIATPIGKGAVSCIRLSGEKSIEIASKLLRGYGKAEHAQMKVCRFEGRVKDKIMAVAYLGGKSYTGEESMELYFHGGKYLTEQALLSLIDRGARLAEAGEFTRRAFLNGKIDLTQAEGIGDLIDGDTLIGLEAAYEQSEGKTKTEIDGIYAQLVHVAAAAEVCIDYPEEDIEEKSREDIEAEVKKIVAELEKQMHGFGGGRIKREGARVALTGKTNAGKSTLFNTLLKEDRAIVSDEEGTTRDTIEEKLLYKGVAMVLVDTAGIRQTDSRVEQMGIERSKSALREADVIVHVVRDKKEILSAIDTDNTVCVYNSFDTVPTTVEQDGTVVLNAKTGDGVDALKEILYKKVKQKADDGGCIHNLRQYESIKEARTALMRSLDALQTLTMDCVCSDLCAALDALGSVTGKRASDAVIDEIFSHFCVGK